MDSKKEVAPRRPDAITSIEAPATETAQPFSVAQLLQRAATTPRTLTPAQVQQLQKTVGNRAVTQLLHAAPAPRPNRLPLLIQAKMQRVLGGDFSDVEIHADSRKAVDAQAIAYAQGEQLHFAPGAYQPDATTGQRLIGHELTHVMQQRAGRVTPTHTLNTGVAVNMDPALEQEADSMGARAAQFSFTDTPSGTPTSQRATGSVLQGVFTTYAAAAVLERGGAPSKAADALTMQGVVLPASARPPTQFGTSQMAHSVSWTLLKKAYETVGSLTPKKTVKQFVVDYLKADWEGLAEQVPYTDDRVQHTQFKAYIAKYPVAYFETLKDASHPTLKWYELLQSAVSDYFVALQLAPLSTHTGFTQAKKGAMDEAEDEVLDDVDRSGVQETQPSSHGEPAANKFFRELEAKLTASGRRDERLKNKVIEKAKAYWDIGAKKEGGIETRAERVILAKEYLRTFAHAYPNVGRFYGYELQNNVVGVDVRKGKGSGSGAVRTDAEDTAEVSPAGKFQAQLSLGESDAPSVTCDRITIRELRLSDDRPPTKYGVLGQKSHTVSWTVVLKAMRRLARGKTLHQFFQLLLAKWYDLQSQDWNSMIGPDASDLIVRGDYKNKKPDDTTITARNDANRVRLRALYAKISPNVEALSSALGGATRGDLAWADLLQSTLSAYIEAYQSAPLTTFKSSEGTPKGHGEGESNKVFESGDTVETMTVNWNAKLRGLLKKRSKTSYSKASSKWLLSEASDKGIVQQLHRVSPKLLGGFNIQSKMGKREEEMAAIKTVVIKELALNYLDVQWRAVQGSGGDNPEAAMAQILHDWEETIRVAYPHVWSTYHAAFTGYSNRFALSPSLIAAKASATPGGLEALSPASKTMASAMDTQRTHAAYQRGLISIRSEGSLNVGGEQAAYNTAKDDYRNGLRSVRAGNRDEDGADAFNKAKVDYLKGLAECEAGTYSLVGWYGFGEAKRDYRAGITACQAGDVSASTVLACQSAKTEYAQGLADARLGQPERPGAHHQAQQDYAAGVEAARTRRPALSGAHAQGHADYIAGTGMATRGTGGMRVGYDDYYQRGVADAADPAIHTPRTLDNVAYRTGYIDERRRQEAAPTDGSSGGPDAISTHSSKRVRTIS